MSVNRFQPHVLILPEDEADRQLANGFFLDPSFWNRGTSFQILTEAGGWKRGVLDEFESIHIKSMYNYPYRFMVLLIDFDGHPEDRLIVAQKAIPPDLTDRVFILGTLSDPEALKTAGLGSYETIGASLAKDCREGTDTTWDHALLRHNASELERLRKLVRPILFD